MRLLTLTGSITETFSRAALTTASAKLCAFIRISVIPAALLALVGVTVWSCRHDERLQRRIANEGCPFDGSGGIGREEEFRDKFCL